MPLQRRLYEPFPSARKHKKYSVYVPASENGDGKRKLLHFGDKRYQHFRDTIGHYSHLDHRDNKRRKAYYARHGPENSIRSARYWSHRVLW